MLPKKTYIVLSPTYINKKETELEIRMVKTWDSLS